MAATGGDEGTRIERKDKKGENKNMCSGTSLHGKSCIDRFIAYMGEKEKKEKKKGK